jgi:hypothetical protein
MKRKITNHHPYPEIVGLSIEVCDEPGPGGASHLYLIKAPDGRIMNTISFQKGGVHEEGINGLTNEALLAIVMDRLNSFDKGPFPTAMNKAALDHCKLALGRLHARTKSRIERGVEGRSVA